MTDGLRCKVCLKRRVIEADTAFIKTVGGTCPIGKVVTPYRLIELICPQAYPAVVVTTADKDTDLLTDWILYHGKASKIAIEYEAAIIAPRLACIRCENRN